MNIVDFGSCDVNNWVEMLNIFDFASDQKCLFKELNFVDENVAALNLFDVWWPNRDTSLFRRFSLEFRFLFQYLHVYSYLFLAPKSS